MGCFYVYVLISLLLAIPFCLASTNANYNYNAYNYDMTTPQFTPDGRLLQVEYASTAADLSTPLVALQMDDTDNTLVLVSLRTSNTQTRMVLLQDDDSSICIAMSGVLADSVALLQKALSQSAQHVRTFHTPWTMLQLATALANACQTHAFGGGIRPYGCTMLVCGFGGVERSHHNKAAAAATATTAAGSIATLYQTDPSGAILKAPSSSSADASSCSIRWMVGGNSALQRQLRKRIDSNLARHKKSSSLADTIALVARTMIKETKATTTTTKSTTASTSSSDDPEAVSLEVVVLSPTLGGHRLTKDQLDAIVARI
jgi:20S proteasome alpha/beta subunit